MNRVKAWLPLGYIPQNCKECPGIKDVSLDHVPVYMCVSCGKIFGHDELIGERKPDWCPMIVEGGWDEKEKVESVHTCKR